MAGWNSALVSGLAASPEWLAALVCDPGRVAPIMQAVALVALLGWARSLTRGRRHRSAHVEAAREAVAWRERYEREVLWRCASDAPEAFAPRAPEPSRADAVPRLRSHDHRRRHEHDRDPAPRQPARQPIVISGMWGRPFGSSA